MAAIISLHHPDVCESAGDTERVPAERSPRSPEGARLAAIRLRLRGRSGVVTTPGYGPRYLHATGPLHRWRPPTGHLLQILDPTPDDISIPDDHHSFGERRAAQAEGNLRALQRRGRPVGRVEGLELLELLQP